MFLNVLSWNWLSCSHLHISMAVVGDGHRRLWIYKEDKMKPTTLGQYSAGKQAVLQSNKFKLVKPSLITMLFITIPDFILLNLCSQLTRS